MTQVLKLYTIERDDPHTSSSLLKSHVRRVVCHPCNHAHATTLWSGRTEPSTHAGVFSDIPQGARFIAKHTWLFVEPLVDCRLGQTPMLTLFTESSLKDPSQ